MIDQSSITTASTSTSPSASASPAAWLDVPLAVGGAAGVCSSVATLAFLAAGSSPSSSRDRLLLLAGRFSSGMMRSSSSSTVKGWFELEAAPLVAGAGLGGAFLGCLAIFAVPSGFRSLKLTTANGLPSRGFSLHDELYVSIEPLLHDIPTKNIAPLYTYAFWRLTTTLTKGSSESSVTVRNVP